MADDRKRVFAFLIYLDSAKENWINILRECNIPAFVSPLHDKDIVEKTGELKKPHYHIMLMYDGMKSLEQVYRIIDEISANRHYIEVNSKSAYARYLCHLDNPDKHQYDIKQVICLGGADYEQYTLSSVEKDNLVSDIIDFVEENHVISYRNLVIYARHNEPKWFRYLSRCNNSFVKEYMKSLQWSIKNGLMS